MPPEPLPAGELQRLRDLDRGALWHPFTQMQVWPDETPEPPVIVRAEGNWLVAADGARYLDANCGYWCLALGCRPERVERAIAEQLQRFGHSTLLGISHEPAIRLAARLTELAGPPLNHAFFADSGSEAVEVALKMAYQCQVLRGHPERSKFLALGEAYHGDTLGAVAVGGVDLFHGVFKPLLFHVHRVPPPHCYRCPWEKRPESCALECASALETALETHAHELAALVIEPFVLGPGGVIPQPAEYLRRAVLKARELGVTVVFDEVAVGMGRLGRLFAFEALGLKPDLVCLAKGLTGGLLPLSAVLASEEIYAQFLGAFAERRTFFHGHTFTGSALGCAAALAALEVFTEHDRAFLKQVQDVTIPAFWKMLEPLRAHPLVGNVRGLGMMAGLEVVADKATRANFDWARRTGHRVVLAARKRGVNLRAIGDLVLAVPPLTITLDEIGLLGRVYREALDEAFAQA
ncbi:MAG: adenosylmethionine--8-amino-7-oxononanoate transaminase [Planctomycetota bacterium]|nr:adenosylmethionine--8-amino-7-oxononanoate transaminase [Planctomycetota bacterium]